MKLLIFTTVLGVCSAGLLPQTYLPASSTGHFSGGSGSFSSGSSSFGGSSAFNAGSASYNSGAYQGSSAGHGGAGAYQGGSGAYQGAGGYQGGSGSYQGAGGYNSGAGAYHGGSSRPQDANAQILRLNSDVNEHGFSYEYETSNGIRAHAQGEATNGVQSQGAFSYKGDDGHDYSITYTADENGYRPQGAHLPTPPPVPEEILRSLEQNARDEAAGIRDDGSYHDSGAGSHSGAGQYSSGGGQYSRPSNQYLAPQQTHRTQPSYNSQSGYHY